MSKIETCPVCGSPATTHGETTKFCVSEYTKAQRDLQVLAEALIGYADPHKVSGMRARKALQKVFGTPKPKLEGEDK